MIKCFGFGKLLKQLFIISLISCFGLLGSSFVNADWIFQEVGTPFTVAGQINYTLNARPSGAGIVEGGGVIVPAFYVPKRWSSYQYYSLFYYNTSGYMVKNSFQNNYPYQGGVYQIVFNSFYLTTPESLSGCSTAFPCGGVSTNYDTYRNNANYKGKMTRFAYFYKESGNYESSICLIFDDFDSAFCFYSTANNTAVNGLTINPAEFDTSLVGNSPRVSNIPSNTGNNQVGDGGDLEGINYVGITGEDLINYFENNPYYKFNKNVCYVGTNDITTLLGGVNFQDIPLNLGSGKNVFEYFSYYYGNNFTIKELGTFISTLRSNYITVFLTPYAERLFLMSYNTGGSVSFTYDSNDLDMDWYRDKPYVEYTYGQITSAFGSVDDGEEIATYCYYKLGINNDSNYSGVIDNHDSSYDENALTYKENYLRNSYYFTGGIIVSESWAGSPLDYLDGTGEENLDFSTFFNKSFNRFKSVFDLDTSTLPIGGFLPTYIIMFLLAIIFFRFISH